MMTSMISLGGGGRWELTFDLGCFEQTGRRMIVTGTFSGWATSFRGARTGFVEKDRRDNTVKLALDPGVYEYKYYDLQAGEWMEVERYPEIYRGYYWDYVQNPFGTMNCVIRVP